MDDQNHDEIENVLDRLERASSPPLDQRETHADTGFQSPTVAGLDPARRPNPLPICAACPHSMWFASAEHLKCFCRLMHVLTWNSEEPSSPIRVCDGILLSNE